MPEFKIRVGWYKEDKQQIWNDKKPQKYHRFSVVNYHDLPSEYFSSQKEVCLIWLVDWIIKDIKDNFKPDFDYQFIIKMGEPKTAHFKHKIRTSDGKVRNNNMILKNKEYWENTVKKIGFWDSENYFYEAKKNQKKPNKKPNNRSAQSENKNKWGKIILVCLPIVIVAFFIFLIIKLMNKKSKK